MEPRGTERVELSTRGSNMTVFSHAFFFWQLMEATKSSTDVVPQNKLFDQVLPTGRTPDMLHCKIHDLSHLVQHTEQSPDRGRFGHRFQWRLFSCRDPHQKRRLIRAPVELRLPWITARFDFILDIGGNWGRWVMNNVPSNAGLSNWALDVGHSIAKIRHRMTIASNNWWRIW